MNWLNIFVVFAGSGLGGACRFLSSKWIQSLFPHSAFPWGTFAVNVLGCLIIGVLYGLIDQGKLLNPELRLLLTVGFCGGFTTFSTFVNENYLLFTGSPTQALTALGYLLASVLVGFVLLYIGHYIGSISCP